MELNKDNYYSLDANKKYLSVSQYKDFYGSFGMPGCEYKALQKIEGKYQEEPNKAMLIGSYVDAYFENTLDEFQEKNQNIFLLKGSNKGGLKSDYQHANKMIERCTKDTLFSRYMSGEKQVIMVGELGGSLFKIKMDSFHPGKCIVDLKTVQSITKPYWTRDYGYLSFVEYWGYDIQLAAYQEIVYQNTGDRLPVYIAAVSKEKEPDIALLTIRQSSLDYALETMIHNIPRIIRLKNKEQEPDRCELCDCCKATKVLDRILYTDAIAFCVN